MKRHRRPAGVVRPRHVAIGPHEPPRPPASGFMGSVNVLTESGWLEISRIVRKRLPLRVACADPDSGRIDQRPIVAWSCRCADPRDLVLLETNARGGKRRRRGDHRAIRVASGKTVPGPAGLRQAGDLRPGDAVYTAGTYLEPWQEQLVLGSFLGDGYSGARAAGRYSGLAICHGHEQRAYLDWKFARLANVGARPPSTQRLSPGGFARHPTSRFTTRMHPRISALAAEFYGSGVKRPPPGVVARAGWLGLGIWFGDDGGCVCSKRTGIISAFRFHTNAFAVAEVDRLAAELRQFTGLPWRRYLQNGVYPILTLGNGDGTPNNRGEGNLARWIELARPYVPPMLAYKLRVASCGAAWAGLAPPGGEWLEETTIKAAGPYRPAPHEDCLLYDLTVADAGTFVVHGILVGDATSRVGARRSAPLEGGAGRGSPPFD